MEILPLDILQARWHCVKYTKDHLCRSQWENLISEEKMKHAVKFAFRFFSLDNKLHSEEFEPI